jgi:hypothetical protein
MTAPQGNLPGGAHTDPRLGYRLTIPDGWGEAERSEEAGETLRLRSADGAATVSVSVVPLGSSGCRAAIEEWLPTAKSAAFTTTVDRTMRISSTELPTVTGDVETLDRARSGALSAFCERGSAVIAVGLAKGSKSSASYAVMASAISSFRYLERERATPAASPTTVRKPPRKAKPPARATSTPRPTPTAAPEPTRKPSPTEMPATPEPEEEDDIIGPR